MSRARRPNLPGLPFHITARVQWQQPLFRGLEAAVVRALAREAAAHEVRPIAHVVMSNHLHIVAVQGPAPLGWFMRSLLRRIALLVMKQHGRGGHVFDRRYFARPCLDPDYLRTAVAYVHLNPVRAGMCAQPDNYPWSSHARYSVRGPRIGSVTSLDGLGASVLRLFGREPGDDLLACALAYHRFLDWRLAADRAQAVTERVRQPDTACGAHGIGCHAEELLAPIFPAGDTHWLREFAPAAAGLPAARDSLPPRRPEIRQLVRAVLLERAPDLDLDTLRAGGRTRPLVEVRRDLIRRCAAAGYRTHQIARYLCISPSTVSAATPRRLPPGPA